VKNLFRVSPELYRSQQVELPGRESLRQLGIKTVVNLRSYHSDRGLLDGSDIDLKELTVLTWRPERRELVEFLRTATDPAKQPVLIHCQHGADRTGAFCAAYRVVVQGWTKQEAIREMRSGGYGFHRIWINLPEWIEKLETEELRRELELSPASLGSAAKVLELESV